MDDSHQSEDAAAGHVNDAGGSVAIDVELGSRVNFALQQNGFKIVQRLRVINPGPADLTDIEVRLHGDPVFFAEWSRRIDRLGAGREIAIEGVDLQLSPSFLLNLTEAIRARVWIEVCRSEEVLLREGRDVEILAYDQWPGAAVLPEIIAAFVLPNHPDIARILSVAADLLEKATGNSALDGYQSEDPRRVWAMASSIYRAVQVLDIEYVNPPASFEREGQKVRTPDRIMADKRGTCLDISLLFAACLEQAGLHPWIVIVKGHAFPGLWLRDDCSPSPVVDDASALRKGRDLGEMRFFDSSTVAIRPIADFDAACSEATRRLADDSRFWFAVDVFQSRNVSQIRPMAGRVIDASFQPIVQPEAEAAAGSSSWTPAELPAEISGAGRRVVAQRAALEGPAARLDGWKRKLLDLSLRNRLLNFRESKKCIPLLVPNVASFEDQVASGRTFDIDPLPAKTEASAPSASDLLRDGSSQFREAAQSHLDRGRVHSLLSEAELERRLLAIYREARSSIEETGANTLYLALGMLRWFPNQTTSEPRNAPILLVPLQIERRSARDRFRISIGTDEPRVNHTLFEMLRHDFSIDLGAIEDLPSDDAGVDVPLVLQTVRAAIREVPRWDVIEDAWIGLFSFSKFLMWRDLAERSGALLANPVISHLLRGTGSGFDSGGSFVSREAVDERPPGTTFCPLDADASQLAAVFSAQEGRSFALWGPPGTGKSQTITNLVAQCLANGKTVLFVAEKLAALNVVRSRLEKVGLGDFCLELHSNKASKTHVLAQLARALESTRTAEPGEWASEASRLEGLRAELNGYAAALGRRRPPDWSAFKVTAELIELREVPRVRLVWPSVERLSQEWLAEIRTHVRRLAITGRAIGGPAEHPWRGIDQTEWSHSWQSAVAAATESLDTALARVRDSVSSTEARLGLTGRAWTLPSSVLLDALVAKLLENPRPHRELLREVQWAEAESVLKDAVVNGRRRDLLRDELAERFSNEIYALDLEQLRSQLRTAEQSNRLLRWFRRRPIVRALRTAANTGVRVGANDAREAIEKALEVEALHAKLDEGGVGADRLLGRDWQGGLADWNRVEQLIEWTAGLRRLAIQLSDGDAAGRSTLLNAWAELACEGNGLLDHDAPGGADLRQYRAALDDLRRTWAEFRTLARLDAERFVDSGEKCRLDVLAERVSDVHSASDRLREWCAWQDARRQAEGSELAPLIEAYERHEIPAGDLERAFEKSVRCWWLEQVTEGDAPLRSFFSPDHERKISDFRKLDERMLHLAGPLVYSRLAASLPRTGADPAASSEMGILLREIRKKARHMPVRRLIEKIPHLLPRLKPCFLMSPLSVAQFLDAELASFDVIVFDEASQIPVWDSIGALARGKQSIVVGDPQQLPPTNFFMRGDDEDDLDGVEVEDQESILDEFLAAQMPELKLDWHYRSRHESLIAFSNQHYYENRLLTFPSPLTDGIGVVHRAVPEGHYDKGKSRTNQAEAQALVAEIVQRLRDPELSRYSLGVVTFSQAQQTRVEDLLDAARREHPEIEVYFGDGVDEPVFVKNLENVQGDERDVILFSIGYGPDQYGRVSMTFGPLNRRGGERRLNVAITRARVELVVFSTLRSEQIDLSRTRATGVEHLKFFLEYAERGPRALLATAAASAGAEFDSPFEREVCRALEAKGHRVELQVGCAGYRIDLAIVDPDAPGRFLLGIECDGAMYHGSRIARERDRLRESVLRGLGWNLHRVWSTDWWDKPAREIEKIEEALREARLHPPGRPSPSLRPIAPQPPGGDGSATDPESLPPRQDVPAAAPQQPPATESAGFGLVAGSGISAQAKTEFNASVPEYRAARLPQLNQTSDALFEPKAVRMVTNLFRTLVNGEAPVTLDAAIRRVGEAWGLARVGSRARGRLREILETTEIYARTTAGTKALWTSAQQAETWSGYRANCGNDQRSIADVPSEEILGAVLAALETNISLQRDDLVREAARLLGFQRMGRIVQDRIATSLDLAIKAGHAEESAGWIRHLAAR